MSDQKRDIENETQQGKASRMAPVTKPEDKPGKPEYPKKLVGTRTFSRETVVRLIGWFKQE